LSVRADDIGNDNGQGTLAIVVLNKYRLNEHGSNG